MSFRSADPKDHFVKAERNLVFTLINKIEISCLAGRQAHFVRNDDKIHFETASSIALHS